MELSEEQKKFIDENANKIKNLIDLTTSAVKNIQWGWSVDDNKQSYIGNPLIFVDTVAIGTSSHFTKALAPTITAVKLFGAGGGLKVTSG